MYQKCLDHQPPTWDICGQSYATSPLTWAQAVQAMEGNPTAIPMHSHAHWEAAAPPAADIWPSPSPGISAHLKHGERQEMPCSCPAHLKSSHDLRDAPENR